MYSVLYRIVVFLYRQYVYTIVFCITVQYKIQYYTHSVQYCMCIVCVLWGAPLRGMGGHKRRTGAVFNLPEHRTWTRYNLRIYAMTRTQNADLIYSSDISWQKHRTWTWYNMKREDTLKANWYAAKWGSWEKAVKENDYDHRLIIGRPGAWVAIKQTICAQLEMISNIYWK